MSQKKSNTDSTKVCSPVRRSARLRHLSPFAEGPNTSTPQKLPTPTKTNLNKLEDKFENTEEVEASKKQNGTENGNLTPEPNEKPSSTDNSLKDSNNFGRKRKLSVESNNEVKDSNVSSLDSSTASSKTDENSLESSLEAKELTASNNIEHTVNIENIKRTLNRILRSSNNKYKIEKMLERLRKKNINVEIDKILASFKSDSSSENESETNSFIDTMAEEDEEDTPSEGSCDIPDIGEAINTTESELSTDESYGNDSFINDDERFELLSGEEFDLSDTKPKRKSRILRLSIGSDEDTVKIKSKEKKLTKRKSRIIRPTMDDSSDEEEDMNEKKDGIENLSSDSKPDPKALPDTKAGNIESNEDCNKISVINENVDFNISEKPVHLEKENDAVKTKYTQNKENNNEDLRNKGQKIIILENIRVQDIGNKDLSDNIQNIITSFCSELKNKRVKLKKKRRRKFSKKKKDKNVLADNNNSKTDSSQASEQVEIKNEKIIKTKQKKKMHKKKNNTAPCAAYLDFNAENKNRKKSRKKKRKSHENISDTLDNFIPRKKRKVDNSNQVVVDIGMIVNNKINGYKTDWIVNEITLKPS